jgi:hypothetical protein
LNCGCNNRNFNIFYENRIYRQLDFRNRMDCINERLRNLRERIEFQLIDNDCICQQLKHLQRGTEVTIILNGATVENVRVACIDERSRCATVVDSEGCMIVLNCSDIQALKII